MSPAGGDPRHREGAAAELLACDHLLRHGLQLVARNFRVRGGEIDLVLNDGDTLVFVEVRFRRSSRFGRPEETVGTTKQRRLIHAARHYLQRHAPDRAARFDVIAVSPGRAGYAIQWFRDAFAAPDA